MDDLTEMQRAFVLAYASGPGTAGNGTKSAIAAGYSEKSARVQSQQLLAKPHVQEAIVREQRKAISRLASIGIEQAETLLTDPKTPAGVKVDLIKAAWDRGGLPTIKDQAPNDPMKKPLSEMTTEELEEFIATGQRRLLGLDKEDDAKVVN